MSKKNSSRTTLYNTLNVVQQNASNFDNTYQSDHMKDSMMNAKSKQKKPNLNQSKVLCSNNDNQIVHLFIIFRQYILCYPL